MNVMSNTHRKDKNGKKFKESNKSAERRFKCRCERCSGLDRNKLIEKIAEKELKTEVKIHIEEGIDFDIPEQDEILEQFFGSK